MSSETTSKILNEANKAANAAKTGLPRPNYDAMSMAHCQLTLQMLEATNDQLQTGEWPSDAAGEKQDAVRMIGAAIHAYQNFLDRYGLDWSDLHEDTLKTADGQAQVARYEEGIMWANKVFASLPDLPKD